MRKEPKFYIYKNTNYTAAPTAVPTASPTAEPTATPTAEPTAEQQRNNRSDLETTRLIRRAVVTDKSLSVYAHNIKIIAQNGVVTLKGPVRSEEEKQAIEKKAAEVAGAAQIKNEIEVTPKK